MVHMKHFYDTDLLENEIFGDEPDPDEFGAEQDGEFAPDSEEPDDAEPADLIFTLTLEDGSEMTCRAECVFLENEKEYIALDMGNDEIQIMELAEGEDDNILLLPLEDDGEREAAFRAFLEIMGTEKGEEYDGDQDGEEN